MSDQKTKKILKIIGFYEKGLTMDEKVVVMYRNGWVYNREYTLKEIGELLHITGERVRQIEKEALEKIAKFSGM